MKDEGYHITLHCLGNCTNQWSPSWDQLIQYFGPDYDLITRVQWRRLRCEKCGHRGAQVIITPPRKTGYSRAPGHENSPEPVSIEEATRRHHERMSGSPVSYQDIASSRRSKARP